MTSTIPCPRKSKTCSGDKSPLEPHRVVCRRPVGRRHRSSSQSQVHAELSAVVHQVIEEHLPVSQKARPAEEGLALKAQLPVLCPGFIGGVLERRAGFGCAFIESLQQLSHGLERHRLIAARGKIQLGSAQYSDAEAS